MKIIINGQEKEVEIKGVYTRKMDREYKEIAFSNAENGKANYSDVEKGMDYLVMQFTGLTQEELDNVAMEDYELLLEKVNEFRNNPLSKTKK